MCKGGDGGGPEGVGNASETARVSLSQLLYLGGLLLTTCKPIRPEEWLMRRDAAAESCWRLSRCSWLPATVASGKKLISVKQVCNKIAPRIYALSKVIWAPYVIIKSNTTDINLYRTLHN